MKLYGSYQQVDPQSADDARAHKNLEKELFIMAKEATLACCGLMTTSSFRINSFRDYYRTIFKKNTRSNQ